MNKKYIIPIVIFITLILLAINFYYMNNYHFELIGNNTILLNVGDSWEDPLYIVDNNKEVKRIDNINYNKEGEYEVNYSIQVGIFRKTITRKVIIYGQNQSTNFIFNMKGNNPYYLMINHEYQEQGYEVYDGIDGLLTDQVTSTNNIDSSIEGTYEVQYQVRNSNGIIKNKNRKVIVYSLNLESKLKNEGYSKNNEIIININDNNYSYTILPNGNKTNNKNINYPVSDNKTYIFNIYDINNNVLNYEINVANIDIEKPTGSCVLSLKNAGAEIIVTAKDNNKIKGYEYQYGNNKTKMISDSSYIIKTMDEKASVTIYDVAGNSNTITCKTIDNSTKIHRSYTIKTYNYNGSNKQYWLYEPNITKRDKVPLLIYFHGGGGSANINAVNSIAIPKNIKDGNNFPYYVVAPHNAHNPSSENYIIELINYLIKNYQIDSKRIILSGGSMGSSAPLRIAGNHPNMFSCIAIIAAYNITGNDPKKVNNIPIWIFQGSNDNYAITENYVKRINSYGGNAKITPYSGGHDAPVNAFLRTDLTNWILNNKTK